MMNRKFDKFIDEFVQELHQFAAAVGYRRRDINEGAYLFDERRLQALRPYFKQILIQRQDVFWKNPQNMMKLFQFLAQENFSTICSRASIDDLKLGLPSNVKFYMVKLQKALFIKDLDKGRKQRKGWRMMIGECGLYADLFNLLKRQPVNIDEAVSHLAVEREYISKNAGEREEIWNSFLESNIRIKSNATICLNDLIEILYEKRKEHPIFAKLYDEVVEYAKDLTLENQVMSGDSWALEPRKQLLKEEDLSSNRSWLRGLQTVQKRIDRVVKPLKRKYEPSCIAMLAALRKKTETADAREKVAIRQLEAVVADLVADINTHAETAIDHAGREHFTDLIEECRQQLNKITQQSEVMKDDKELKIEYETYKQTNPYDSYNTFVDWKQAEFFSQFQQKANNIQVKLASHLIDSRIKMLREKMANFEKNILPTMLDDPSILQAFILLQTIMSAVQGVAGDLLQVNIENGKIRLLDAIKKCRALYDDLANPSRRVAPDFLNNFKNKVQDIRIQCLGLPGKPQFVKSLANQINSALLKIQSEVQAISTDNYNEEVSDRETEAVNLLKKDLGTTLGVSVHELLNNNIYKGKATLDEVVARFQNLLQILKRERQKEESFSSKDVFDKFIAEIIYIKVELLGLKMPAALKEPTKDEKLETIKSDEAMKNNAYNVFLNELNKFVQAASPTLAPLFAEKLNAVKTELKQYIDFTKNMVEVVPLFVQVIANISSNDLLIKQLIAKKIKDIPAYLGKHGINSFLNADMAANREFTDLMRDFFEKIPGGKKLKEDLRKVGDNFAIYERAYIILGDKTMRPQGRVGLISKWLADETATSYDNPHHLDLVNEMDRVMVKNNGVVDLAAVKALLNVLNAESHYCFDNLKADANKLMPRIMLDDVTQKPAKAIMEPFTEKHPSHYDRNTIFANPGMLRPQSDDATITDDKQENKQIDKENQPLQPRDSFKR